MPRVDLLAARPDADYIVATTEFKSGLPNSIPLSALSVPIGFADDIQLRFGGASGGDTVFEWNTDQTKDAMMVGVSGSNNFTLTTKGLVNAPQDFAFADSPIPRLYITSAAAATDEWSSWEFDGADTNIRTSKGNINLNGTVHVTSHIEMGDLDVLKQGGGDDSLQQFTGTDFTHTFASMAATDFDGGDYKVTAQAGGTGGTGNHKGGDYLVTAGAKAGSGADGTAGTG